MNNIDKLEEGLRVCVSVKTLFDYLTEGRDEENVNFSNGYIEKSVDGKKVYYDLYNNQGELACMDGEIIFVSSINKQSDTITLINNNGEHPVYFELYAEEIEEVLFINMYDIKYIY